MSFTRDRHIRYWRMCAKTLPDHYMSNDSNRMTLGFFIISALDLLDALDTIDPAERQSWVSWIYSCQVPEGGFRGFTGTNLRSGRRKTNRHWDPAHLPATFFALATLLILGDNFSRVRRSACLKWLRDLQRVDGSFGETLSEDGEIEGDRDLRQCCCAAGIAYMLQRPEELNSPIDVERIANYVQSCQDRSGGFGASPYREPHSGLTYCAIATLSFLERIHQTSTDSEWGETFAIEQCTKWLLERQTHYIDVEEDGEDGEDDEEQSSYGSNNEYGTPHLIPTKRLSSAPAIDIAGFNGRDGKVADTCYAFWNTGSLAVFNREHLVDAESMKRYLLEVTQHRIGGFGKSRNDPPDVLHSYLGLATLALFGQSDVKPLDPTMCMSISSAGRLDEISLKTDADYSSCEETVS